jgi:hypothetical protein
MYLQLHCFLDLLPFIRTVACFELHKDSVLSSQIIAHKARGGEVLEIK